MTFESQRIEGSINLYGATFDDLSLKDYYETINKSEKIKVLSEDKSNQPYFLRLGWASTDRKTKMPGKDSLWIADKTSYKINDEINLSWDNGNGLQFKRKLMLMKTS